MNKTLRELILSYKGCGMKREYEGTKTFYEAASCHYWNARGRCVKRPHQNKQRISNARLYQFADLLVTKQSKLETCTNFEDLKQLIDSVECTGIGPVTRYDVATAIGYLQSPKVLPEKYVYLHAGVTKGYNALANAGILPPSKKNKVPIEAFDCLKELQCAELQRFIPKGATFSMIVEDFLCVMHEELQKLNSK